MQDLAENASLTCDSSVMPNRPSHVAGAVGMESSPSVDTIYRPFFRAGIAVALTLGAGWGVLLLLRTAWSGQFSGLSVHEVNAHGHAQIFGWVGLFVMGFAYQFLPRFKHTSPAHPALAYASFWMMLAGLVTRSAAQSLTAWWPWVGWVGAGASVVEIGAASIVLLVVAATLRSSVRGWEVSDYYILAALGWFFLQTVAETVYFAATLLAPDREALLNLIATWQGPLREVQIHGFATLMIFGVSQRLLVRMYGLAPPKAGKSAAVLAIFNGAVVGLVLGLILMRTSGHGWAGLWYAAVLALAGSATWLVYGWGLFRPTAWPDRSLKFIRTAYVWLFVSLAMSVLLPVYHLVLLPWLAPDSAAAQMGFSHAYYGAIRHAATVGFISMMIVGVAANVVPALNGFNGHSLPRLWLPYTLLVSGCTLRVAGQSLTDFTAWAFPVTGVSGVLELTGLALWGFHMLRLMAARRPRESAVQFVSSESLSIGGAWHAPAN